MIQSTLVTFVNGDFHFSAWHVSMAVAILFLLPKSPNESDDDDKYTILETRPPINSGYLGPPPVSRAESSFKHYPEDMDTGPEVINVTSSAGVTGTLEHTTTLRSTSSMAALNNGGSHGGTLPRSSLVRNYAHSHHGTLKKSADELRPLTADGHYHGHSHNTKPSIDTLRRVHFEKTTSNGATPASPPKVGTLPVSAPSVPTHAQPVSTSAVVCSSENEQPMTVVTTTAPSITTPEDEDEGDTAM